MVMFSVAFVFVIHVEPVHVMFNVAFVFVIQSSSSLHGLLPFVGLTNVLLAGPSCVTSGPSCVCCGIYRSVLTVDELSSIDVLL